MTVETDLYEMKFRRRTWLPDARLDFAAIRSGCNAPSERVHFLLQFKRIPRSEQRAAITAAVGVNFTSYAGGNAYVVSMGFADLEALLGIDLIRGAFPLEPELKIDSRLRSDFVPPHAQRPGGKITLNVRFHEDIDAEHARALTERLGGEVRGQTLSIQLVTAAFLPEAVSRVAAEDAVLTVDFVDSPLVPKSAEPRPAPTKG